MQNVLNRNRSVYVVDLLQNMNMIHTFLDVVVNFNEQIIRKKNLYVTIK
jgi:hypothetical protein